MRHRIPLHEQDGRIHRHALCLHGGPKTLQYRDTFGNTVSLNAMWGRRMATKFNGVSYITQRGAAAAYSDEGYAQLQSVIADYMENARIIREGLQSAGYTVYGGVNAPYIWLRVPHGDSWRFYDELLERHHIVGTPGAGFGRAGRRLFPHDGVRHARKHDPRHGAHYERMRHDIYRRFRRH